MTLNLPRRDYKELHRVAEEFLSEYHPEDIPPVPIEQIIETRFKISLIPIPGLLDEFKIDGFISSSLKEISIDEFVYMKRERRARFTLAHELSHLILHRDIILARRVETIENYKTFRDSMEDEYRWLEWQASCLAGLILVPTVPLRAQFELSRKQAETAGLNPSTEPAVKYICDYLSDIFNVSAQVVQYRLTKEGLVTAEFPFSDGV